LSKLTLFSPAKVNLFLRVKKKRKDGYHEISSIIHQINLYDEIYMELSQDPSIKVCGEGKVICGEKNLCYKAADAILKYTKKKIGVSIFIKKRIPVSSGLGGGSSNAAMTLIGLNKLLNLRLNKRQLMKIGQTLGADVPFFIFSKTALASGIGTNLIPFYIKPILWFVLIYPNIEISTKWTYESLKLNLTNSDKNIKLPPSINKIEELSTILYNDLEKVVLSFYPQIKRIKNQLLELGAIGSLMSGSGSTVFGLFSTEKDAYFAYQQILSLSDSNYSVFIARSL